MGWYIPARHPPRGGPREDGRRQHDEPSFQSASLDCRVRQPAWPAICSNCLRLTTPGSGQTLHELGLPHLLKGLTQDQFCGTILAHPSANCNAASLFREAKCQRGKEEASAHDPPGVVQHRSKSSTARRCLAFVASCNARRNTPPGLGRGPERGPEAHLSRAEGAAGLRQAGSLPRAMQGTRWPRTNRHWLFLWQQGWGTMLPELHVVELTHHHWNGLEHNLQVQPK
jgi:hypothetical protein